MLVGLGLGLAACAVETTRDRSSSAEDVEQTTAALSSARQGYAWVNLKNGTVNSSYSWSSSNGAITVASTSVGQYTVTFAGLGAGLGGSDGNVQAIAYGTNNTRCKVASFAPTPNGFDENVAVRCHAAATGSLVDSCFVVKYASSGTPAEGAFVWANQPTIASYTPLKFNWNSTGVFNRITQTGTGTYRVTLPGLGADANSSAEVTAVGSGSEHCKVDYWLVSGSDMLVGIRCYDQTGVAVNTQFSLNFVHSVGFYGQGARAFANDATNPFYSPDLLYSYDSTSRLATQGQGHVTAYHTGIGTYSMTYSLMESYNAAPYVTAKGTDNKYCKLAGWGLVSPGSTDMEVDTRCYSGTGALADATYLATYFVGAPLQ